MNNAHQVTHMLGAGLSFERIENTKPLFLAIREETHAKKLAGWLRFVEKKNPNLIQHVTDKRLSVNLSKRMFVSFEKGLELGTYPKQLGKRGPNNAAEAGEVIPPARLRLIRLLDPNRIDLSLMCEPDKEEPEPPAGRPETEPGAAQTARSAPEPDGPVQDPFSPIGLPEPPVNPDPEEFVLRDAEEPASTDGPDAASPEEPRDGGPGPGTPDSPANGTVSSVAMQVPFPILNLSAASSMILGAIGSVQPDEARLKQRLHELNARLVDLQHVSEFYELDRQQSYRLQKDMHATRVERRQVKDQLACIDALKEFAKNPSTARLDKLANLPDDLNRRKYAFRHMTDQEVDQILHGRPYKKRKT